MVVSWQQTKGGEKRILDSGLASKVLELYPGNTDSLILLIEEIAFLFPEKMCVELALWAKNWVAPQFWSKTILQGMSRGIRRTSGLNKEKEVAAA